MQTLKPIPVSDLILAARQLTTVRGGRNSGEDRAIWIAARNYDKRAATIQLPVPIVDRALELLGNPNRGYD